MNKCYTAFMTRQLTFVNNLVAEGREEFSFEDAQTALGTSPPATANTLRGLTEKGLIDRVRRGLYVVRPLGSLGTSTATESLSLAVGAAFRGQVHRIAYLSALSDLGVLSHPVRTVFVACTEQVRSRSVSNRPLHVVIEKLETIHLDTDRVGNSWRSSLERALLECAMRVDLVGNVERLAEGLANSASEVDPARISDLSAAFGAKGSAAERRLASLATALNLGVDLRPHVDKARPVIKLETHDPDLEWIDQIYRVAWSRRVEELQSVVGN